MTVLAPAAGDKFVVRVLKHLQTNPDNVWANSYEGVVTEEGGLAELFNWQDAICTFEAAIHDNDVFFDRAIISTWEPDSFPYDPASFASIPLDLQGQISDITNENVTTGMAWRVNRQCASGRFGNLFYRGVLHENQVSAPAGKPILSDPSAMAELLSDSIDSSLLTNYFGITATGGIYLAMISADGSQVRPVTQFVSSGVSLIKQDHMWFNRTPPS